MVFCPLLCFPSFKEDSNPPLNWNNWVLATSYNIFALLVEGYLDFGGLGLEELGAKLVNMGYDGSNVFQGHRIGVS